MSKDGTHQTFEFHQEDIQLPGEGGSRRRMAFRQHQSMIVLGRKDLEGLADIPTPYLIDELHTRGMFEPSADMLRGYVEKILELIGGTTDAWYRLRNVVFLSAKEKWGNTEQAAKMMDVTWKSASNAMRESINPYKKGIRPGMIQNQKFIEGEVAKEVGDGI